MSRTEEMGNATGNWGLDVTIRVVPLERKTLLPVWLCDCLVGALGLAALLGLSALAHWL
jgi:hypothetical protein